jgi:integrase/recombinase XerD
LASARRSQLDLERKRLTVVGKGNKLRVIDLEPFGAIELFRALPETIGRAPLFWHGSGQRYANVASRFAWLSKELAEQDPNYQPFRFHDLRHLHAVEWLQSGRSIYDLQQRLGHGSIQVTEMYLKFLTPEEKRKVK